MLWLRDCVCVSPVSVPLSVCVIYIHVMVQRIKPTQLIPSSSCIAKSEQKKVSACLKCISALHLHLSLSLVRHRLSIQPLDRTKWSPNALLTKLIAFPQPNNLSTCRMALDTLNAFTLLVINRIMWPG